MESKHISKASWFNFYPPSVPPELPPTPHQNLAQAMERACETYADRPAASCLGQTMTYRELGTMTDRFAGYLQHLAGVKQGDRVAIMLPNTIQFLVSFYAVQKIGAVGVCTNPLYTSHEMQHQFADSGCETLIILDLFAGKLAPIVRTTKIKRVVLVGMADCLPVVKRTLISTLLKIKNRTSRKLPQNIQTFYFRAAIRPRPGLPPVKASTTHTDLACLQYTGGTTGKSKGAQLSQHNLLTNAMVVDLWTRPKFNFGTEVALVAMPLYHIASLTLNALGMLLTGQHLVLVPQPIPIKNSSKIFKKYRITQIFGVNTFINALNHCPLFNQIRPKEIKIAFSGGTAVQKSVNEHWEKIVGIPLTAAYGLSETSPFVLCNPVGARLREGSAGIPVPSTQVKIFNDQGNEVANGESGEIVVRGPQVMTGYWQQPQETQEAIRDGWLWTGDIGKRDDDGYFYILDRRKDLIIVSGFNVYPIEVEEVLAGHPKVLEAAVIGVEDSKSGEAVKAFIVAKDPSLSEAELKKYCETLLTNYKRPRFYEFRAGLPKTNVGKILRRELRVRDK
jgi:long-chain acyl-CoA synthetase